MPPDVVYVNRTGDNPELRYSLRTLSNVPHGTVHIAGYVPPWVKNVNGIAVTPSANKYRSMEANLQAALLSDEVSDPFYLFNDDFFILKKMQKIPTLHRGLLQDVIDSYAVRSVGNRLTGLRQAQSLLQGLGVEEPLYCYEMHSPLLVQKEGMLETLSLRGSINVYMLRTVYGNLLKIGGRQSSDVKVYRGIDHGYTQQKLLSTTDIGFKYQRVGFWLKERYPVPSNYEQ